MRRYLSILAGALVAGGAVLLSTACSRTEAVETPSGTPSTPTVAVAKASVGDLSRGMVLTAEFAPYQEIDVMAKVSGYVKRINVDIGDRVHQGQVLATLEVPEMADDLTKAAAAVDRNSADVAHARDELQRAESAHDMAHLSHMRLAAVLKTRPGLVAQQEIDDAHSRDLVAEAQVSAAKSALAATQEQVKVSQADHARYQTLYNYAVVTAPFDGVITRRFADTGSMIQAGTASQTQAMPVVRLSQNSLLRLVLPVPESAVSQVRVGQAVEVRVPSLKRAFSGRVARFADKLQLGTRTMPTEVDVPNPRLILIPGMYAEVDLQLQNHVQALSVPMTAIGGPEGRPTVYLVSGQGTIEERAVKTGLETASRVEILSGLSAGDLVVIGNRSQLKPGDAVRPKLTELAAAKGEN